MLKKWKRNILKANTSKNNGRQNTASSFTMKNQTKAPSAAESGKRLEWVKLRLKKKKKKKKFTWYGPQIPYHFQDKN